MITVARKSGLAVPFDPPELTMEASIERACVVGDSGLLEPKSEEYLPVYPVDRPWMFAPARIPWRDNWRYSMERIEPAHGPFIAAAAGGGQE